MKLSALSFMLLSLPALGLPNQCPAYKKIYSELSLKNKKFVISKVSKKTHFSCAPLTEPLNPNLEINLVKKNLSFKNRIHASLESYYDYKTKGQNWAGGVKPQDEIYIDTFLPKWYPGSLITISNLHSKKVLYKGKL